MQSYRALIIGGVIFLAFFVIQAVSGWQSRQDRAAYAFADFLEASSMYMQTELTLFLPVDQEEGSKRPVVGVTTRLEGDVMYAQSAPKFNGTLLMEAQGRGMRLFADGDIVIHDDAVAFRLDNLPALLDPEGNLVEQWTHVNTSLLHTHNTREVQAVMSDVAGRMSYDGKQRDSESGRSMHVFSVMLDEGDQDLLVRTFQYGSSGNQGLHTIARLLRAFDVVGVRAWVDDKELRVIEMAYQNSENEEHRAVLHMSFSEYGKDVAVDMPPRELSVRPEVFGHLFGADSVDDLP